MPTSTGNRNIGYHYKVDHSRNNDLYGMSFPTAGNNNDANFNSISNPQSFVPLLPVTAMGMGPRNQFNGIGNSFGIVGIPPGSGNVRTNNNNDGGGSSNNGDGAGSMSGGGNPNSGRGGSTSSFMG